MDAHQDRLAGPLLRERDSAFVGVDHLLMTERGRDFAYAIGKRLPLPSAWLVRREVMLRWPFPPDLMIGERGAWWQQTMSAMAKNRIPEPLLKYRVRDISISSAHPWKQRSLFLSRLSRLPLLL